MATIAEFVQAVLKVIGLADAAQRLWSIRMQLDFRAFAELVGAVLLIGSIYIVRKDKARKTNKEDTDLKHWVYDAPGTDVDAAHDKNLYMRINRLITAQLGGSHHSSVNPNG